MRRILQISLVVWGALTVGATAPAVAQDSSAPLPTDSPARVLALGTALAEAGRADKDPLKLILAADLIKASRATALSRVPDGGAADGGTYAFEALLAEAITAAKDDARIKALAEDVRAKALKGRVASRGYSVATARGAATDWYRGQRFKANEAAEVVVTALTGAGFDLFVYDDKGNLICRDIRQQHRGYCGWRPGTEGNFDIKIENRTASPLKYQLTTN